MSACSALFRHLGSGLRRVAWGLVRAGGRAHLLHLEHNRSSFDLGYEPFSATAADAYCYCVALGRADGARALQFMALSGDEVDKYDGRIEC